MAVAWLDTELNIYHRDQTCPDAAVANRYGFLQADQMPDAVARERLSVSKCGRCQEMTRKKGLPGDSPRG